MIGVIADDLTGAAELGAVGLRHGLRAEIVLWGEPSGDADLVCVDTDSRSCASEEAGRRAASAARLLRAAKARWIYKKVDSVLRGQVTAEVESVMRQLRLKRALLLPANPSLGRKIRDGRYFVGGRPIHKTEFARDPEHPRTSAQVLRLVTPSSSTPICVSRPGDSLPGRGIVIGEAATAQDVQLWANCRDTRTLSAGGSEYFGMLLTAEKKKPAASEANGSLHDASGRELFVCGTSSQSSRKFVKAARAGGTPVFSLPMELAWRPEFTPGAAEVISERVVAAFQSQARVVLNVGLPPVREVAMARLLSEHLVQIAERVLRQVDVGHVYAEGGATATELVRRMGWGRLKVVSEPAPGVATLAIEGQPVRWLTVKPGTYAWPEQWTAKRETC
ncbi:MAG TPA: four-carbon acid sugar kinase family protein [Candidatus Acidoferrum sp.]|nr:four-carbon acid sugar kinase family protein [Candidatus Acidoferrum sp.]